MASNAVTAIHFQFFHTPNDHVNGSDDLAKIHNNLHLSDNHPKIRVYPTQLHVPGFVSFENAVVITHGFQ